MEDDFNWDDNEAIDGQRETAKPDASMKSLDEQNVQLEENPKPTDSNQDSRPLESDGQVLEEQPVGQSPPVEEKGIRSVDSSAEIDKPDHADNIEMVESASKEENPNQEASAGQEVSPSKEEIPAKEESLEKAIEDGQESDKVEKIAPDPNAEVPADEPKASQETE